LFLFFFFFFFFFKLRNAKFRINLKLEKFGVQIKQNCPQNLLNRGDFHSS